MKPKPRFNYFLLRFAHTVKAQTAMYLFNLKPGTGTSMPGMVPAYLVPGTVLVPVINIKIFLLPAGTVLYGTVQVKVPGSKTSFLFFS